MALQACSQWTHSRVLAPSFSLLPNEILPFCNSALLLRGLLSRVQCCKQDVSSVAPLNDANEIPSIRETWIHQAEIRSRPSLQRRKFALSFSLHTTEEGYNNNYQVWNHMILRLLQSTIALFWNDLRGVLYIQVKKKIIRRIFWKEFFFSFERERNFL